MKKINLIKKKEEQKGKKATALFVAPGKLKTSSSKEKE